MVYYKNDLNTYLYSHYTKVIGLHNFYYLSL